MNNFIHWYPGHIAKAQKQLKEKLKQIDVVLEVLDARIPFSSKYKSVGDLIGNKPKIILLNKSDLADSLKNSLWIKKIEEKYACSVISTSTKNQKDTKAIINKILKTAKPLFEKLELKGLLPRPVRVLVIGMPNVGKSSIINKLCGRAKAKTGAIAGITRTQQWIRVHPKIDLLDTPGIIPPVQDNQQAALKLAMVNSISQNAYDEEFVAGELLKILNEIYPEVLKKYYNTNKTDIQNIALAKNWLAKNGQPDTGRTCRYILTNFRSGKIGNFTLDKPEDF